MQLRTVILLTTALAGYAPAPYSATLQNVDVSRQHDRYSILAATHLDASPRSEEHTSELQSH